MELFAQATRNKLRFASVKGLITTEDLWSLNLQALNTIAVELNKQLKELPEESFIDENPKDEILQLKFDVVRYIIDVKKLEKKEREQELERKKAKEELLELRKEKQKELMKGMSLEEIDKQLENL